MRKILFILLAVISVATSSKAVLTGRSLEETIAMLNSEHRALALSVDSISSKFEAYREVYLAQLNALRNEADAVSIMLYSQKDTYVFGQAYAAEKVEEIVKKFDSVKVPIEYWHERYMQNIHRCERLMQTLVEIDTLRLSAAGLAELKSGKERMERILSVLHMWSDQIEEDGRSFAEMGERVRKMDSDALEYYKGIHKRVFMAVDKNYLEVLSNLGAEWEQAKKGLTGVLSPSIYAHDYANEWGNTGGLIKWTNIILFVIGICSGIVIVVLWHRKHPDQYKSYHMIIGWLLGWCLTTIGDLILRFGVVDNQFYQSVLSLCIDTGVLNIVLLISVALRVNVKMVRRTLVCYTPTLLITFATIGFRMTLADAAVIRFCFVPILAAVTIMQIVFNRRNCRAINKFDCTVSLTSFGVYVVSLILACIGMYFLSIQIVTFWTILLTGHLLLSCIYTFIKRFESRRRENDEEYNDSFLHLTLQNLVSPVIFLLVAYACIYGCAHIFNIVDWVRNLFTTYFVDYPDQIRISMSRIIEIGLLALATNFIVRSIRMTLRHVYGKRSSVGAMGMSVQISTIIIWGTFVVISLAFLEVNSMGLLAVVSGIMVGIGIALRDTLDCFFCGLTMMMGRVKIGDFVECDGVRGWVRNIEYRTTQVETESGCVISFFNTSFFGKNYRNLTAVSKYERMQINFKIQKDADIREMRKVFLEELRANVPEIQTEPAPQILFVGSYRFYVELMAQVWLPTEDYIRLSSMVKETLFYTLKERGLSNMMEDKRTIRLEQATPETME